MKSTDELASRRCMPLKGPDHRLSGESVDAWLADLPGWSAVEAGAAIVKTFRFPDYYQTMAFVNALAFIAHAQDHHPDLGVHYNRVQVRFSTHDVGGLSENDFICAAKVEQLAGTQAAH